MTVATKKSYEPDGFVVLYVVLLATAFVTLATLDNQYKSELRQANDFAWRSEMHATIDRNAAFMFTGMARMGYKESWNEYKEALKAKGIVWNPRLGSWE